jgi:inner membrane protein
MPSYKKHILVSLIMVLPFFPEVFYLSLAVIATSLIDLDRKLLNKNLVIMVLGGVLVALILYLFKLPYILGIILVLLALVFYVSKHRGLAHSIFGIIAITVLLTFLVMGSYWLLVNYTDMKIIFLVILLILGFMVLNEKLIVPYSVLVIIGIILSPGLSLNLYYILGAVFLGCFSHVTLDLFTPTGVTLFSPLSSGRYHKKMGMLFLILWILSALGYFIYLYY